MKIAFVTNKRTPYRGLQLSEFSKIENVKITVYYTHKEHENRKWNLVKRDEFKEVNLRGIKLNKTYGYINAGIIKIVKNNDLIIIGGYEQPTYILISILCRFFRKKYIICFDGISTNRLYDNENRFKKKIKGYVVNNSEYILGNGIVSRKYFNEIFNYPLEKIYNQYLSVDNKIINNLYKDRNKYRNEYRRKLNITDKDKVLIYSGRLVKVKNVEFVIRALSKIKKENLVFLITGGGDLEEELVNLSKRLGVKTIITGFISEQEELFKHYFIGDALILASTYEPWGLVINEAMSAGLPIIASEICGSTLDLVIDGENGYRINVDNINDASEKINKVLYEDNIMKMGENSRKLISKWNVKNSKKMLEKIIYC